MTRADWKPKTNDVSVAPMKWPLIGRDCDSREQQQVNNGRIAVVRWTG